MPPSPGPKPVGPTSWVFLIDSERVCPVNIAVGPRDCRFHNELESEERVGSAGTMASGKLSMRSVLKRGSSNPF